MRHSLAGTATPSLPNGNVPARHKHLQGCKQLRPPHTVELHPLAFLEVKQSHCFGAGKLTIYAAEYGGPVSGHIGAGSASSRWCTGDAHVVSSAYIRFLLKVIML